MGRQMGRQTGRQTGRQRLIFQSGLMACGIKYWYSLAKAVT
jgi:hypothetical protein